MKKLRALGGIYAITNTITGKQYVGSAKRFSRRWNGHLCHLRANKHHSYSLQKDWNQYGWANFSFSVLEVVENSALLVAREQFWIDALQVVLVGYNINPTAKSQLGFRFSAESKKKMGDSRRGRTHTAETRRKISEGQKGKTISASTRKKIGDANRGRKVSAQGRANMGAAQLGRKLSSEHIEKVRTANLGRIISPEWRAKISASKIRSNAKKRVEHPELCKQTREHVEKREKSRLATVLKKRMLREANPQ